MKCKRGNPYELHQQQRVTTQTCIIHNYVNTGFRILQKLVPRFANPHIVATKRVIIWKETKSWESMYVCNTKQIKLNAVQGDEEVSLCRHRLEILRAIIRKQDKRKRCVAMRMVKSTKELEAQENVADDVTGLLHAVLL